jgi:23S rRNA (uridine2552-2'-O)-methyltransferase
MARNHHTKDGDWKSRRRKDHFAHQAKAAGYRSRAAWKLIEINDKDRLINRGSVVIDLGAAPGSWSQVALKEVGVTGRVVAVDRLPIEPLDNLEIIEGDFMKADVQGAVKDAAQNKPIDLVLSDMAPNISGVRDFDQARSIELATAARKFALEHLRPGGRLVLKLFEGTETVGFKRDTRKLFEVCTVRKPSSSRSESTEFFLVARRSNVV